MSAEGFTVSATRHNGDDTGVNRLWVVDEATFDAVVALLPAEPFETTLFTPDDVEVAMRVCDGMLTVYSEDVDAD